MNIDARCNAFYDGNSVNFYRSGGGCNNTGDIHDVAHHEWGHGLDNNTRAGGMYDGARGEAIGDIVAFLSTHSPYNAPFFRIGVPFNLGRTADEAIAGLKTFSNIAGMCPAGGGRGPPLAPPRFCPTQAQFRTGMVYYVGQSSSCRRISRPENDRHSVRSQASPLSSGCRRRHA